MYGFFQTTFYFGNMLVFSIGFGIMTGRQLSLYRFFFFFLLLCVWDRKFPRAATGCMVKACFFNIQHLSSHFVTVGIGISLVNNSYIVCNSCCSLVGRPPIDAFLLLGLCVLPSCPPFQVPLATWELISLCIRYTRLSRSTESVPNLGCSSPAGSQLRIPGLALLHVTPVGDVMWHF